MLARHLASLRPKLKRFLADSAVGISADVTSGDLNGRHRLNGRLRCRRMNTIPPSVPSAVDLDLRQLLQQPIKPGSHQEIRHTCRKGAEAGPSAVIVIELEAAGRSPVRLYPTFRSSTEDDDRVERRSIPVGGGAASTARRWGVSRSVVEKVHGRMREPSAAAALGRNSGRRADFFQESTVAVGADDGVVGQDPDESATSVAPI